MRTFAVEDILLRRMLPIDTIELKTEILTLVLRVGDAHDGWWSGRLTVGADGRNDSVSVEFSLEERPYACDYTDRHFLYCKERGAQGGMLVVATNLMDFGVRSWELSCCQGQRSRLVYTAALDKSYPFTTHSFIIIRSFTATSRSA